MSVTHFSLLCLNSALEKNSTVCVVTKQFRALHTRLIFKHLHWLPVEQQIIIKVHCLHTRDWIILHLHILVIYWSIPMPSRSIFKNFKRLTRKYRVHYFHSVVCVKTRLFNTVYRKFYIIIYFIKRDADTSTWNWWYDWWLIEWLINHTIDYSGYD